METEAEEEPGSILRLPLFSLSSTRSSDLLTSPLHTVASVPFRWEEQPGKPLPCTALSLPTATTATNTIKCLDLPPRLLIPTEAKLTKTPSPTTVLEGPYVGGRSIFHSSSFRFIRSNRRTTRESSSSSFESGESSPDRGLLGPMVLSSSSRLSRDKTLFGSLRNSFDLRGKKENISTQDDKGKKALLGLPHSRSRFWATIYGALKQAMPRRNPATKPKWKKDAL